MVNDFIYLIHYDDERKAKGVMYAFIDEQEGVRFMDKQFAKATNFRDAKYAWREELNDREGKYMRWYEMKSITLMTEFPNAPGIVRGITKDEFNIKHVNIDLKTGYRVPPQKKSLFRRILVMLK